MGFIRQLGIPVIKIQEFGKVWAYTKSLTSSGLVYYNAPQEKNVAHKNGWWREYLFLPIEYETFREDRRNYYYGFRFLVICPGFTTLAFPNIDQFPPPISTTELAFEASRIRYFMEDDDEFDIVIDFAGDSMFPTRKVTIEQADGDITETMQYVTDQLIDSHCNWYANKRI